MKSIALIMVVLMLALAHREVRATAQIPDVVVLDGRELALNTNPLEPYLQANKGKAPVFEETSSALWRGYVATWEIRGSRLWLNKVAVQRLGPAAKPGQREEYRDVDVLRSIFPRGGPVPATWYTGALIMPLGDVVDYLHQGYGSTYERYLVSIVRAGREAKRMELSLDEFRAYRDRKFRIFKTTEAYRKAFVRLREESMDRRQAERFLHEFESERYLAAKD